VTHWRSSAFRFCYVKRSALSNDVLDRLDDKFGLIALNVVAALFRLSKLAIFRSAD